MSRQGFVSTPFPLGRSSASLPIVLVFLLTLSVLLVAGTGCQASECAQLDECCAASADLEGIGAACGEFSTGVKDPDKCRTITKTVAFMYEDRGVELPAACRLE